MSKELTNILETKFIPTKKAIHDCVDTGNDLVLTSGIEVDYPVDCVGRDYKSTATSLWDGLNSIIKDTIDNTEIRVKFKMILNGAVNDICTIRIYVPHPTLGNIEIDSQDMVLYKNNIDTVFTRFTLLYNGTDSEAKDYGFKVTLTPSGNMTLKSRSILVTV
jgi:hypothetical protein